MNSPKRPPADFAYRSDPELSNPRGFLTRAFADLASSLAIGWTLHKAGFGSRRRAALLGWIWLVVPPFATAATCLYFQSRRILDTGPTKLPYSLHVFIGVIVWQLLVDSMQAPIQQIRSARGIVTRSTLPHEALLIAGLWDVLVGAAIRLPLILVAALAVGVPPGWSALLIPVGMLAVILFGFGLGLLIAPLGVLYDDVQRAMFLITGVWFVLTPVMYSADRGGLSRLNPLTPLLDTTRSWLVTPAIAPGFSIVVSASSLLLPIAWLAYRLARPHIVETLG